MFLSDVAVFAVKPSVKRGFYEMSSLPQIAVATDEWLDTEMYEFGAKRVKNAKLVGIHNSAAVMETDIRFNGRDTPRDDVFVVVKRKDGTFAAALEINAPEAAILMPVLKMLVSDIGWGGPWVELTEAVKKKVKPTKTAAASAPKVIALEIPAVSKAAAPKKTAASKKTAAPTKKPAAKKVAADKEAAKFDPKLGVINVMNKLRAKR